MQLMLSTVTPVYSGGSYLVTLVEQINLLRIHLEKNNAPIRLLESIFVDDGSIDDSSSVLKDLSEKYSWVRVLQLSRNFGQHPATTAGILYTSGDWLVTLDEDLQHSPHLIESMLLKAVTEKADVVYVNPIRGTHGSLIRDLGSKYTKKAMSFLTGNSKINNSSSFRLIRGDIARATSSVCSHNTYFDIALCWFTNNITAMHHPLRDERHMLKRKSGYSFLKLLSHAKRMLFSANTKISRIGGVIGFVMCMLSFVSSVYLGIKVSFLGAAIEVRGWTSTMIAIMFIGGVILLLVGILLEYMSVVLLHTQGKPAFFVVDRSTDDVLIKYFMSLNYACSA